MNTFATQNQKKMQKKIDESLLKDRSPRASLSAGFRLYTEHFRRIFKSTWLTALIAAVVSGVASTALYIYWPGLVARVYSDLPHAWMYAREYMLLLGIIGILVLLAIVAITAFFGSGAASILRLQKEEKVSQWRMIGRSWKALCCNAVLCLIAYGAIAAFVFWKRDMLLNPLQNIVSVTATVVLLTVVGIFLLPTIYITVKYLMDRTTSFWPLLARSYGLSMRYWMRQFIVLLVCLIVLGLFHLICSTPEFILSEANWQARIGVVGGDPLGMPSYITVLTFVTCSVITFLQLYIWLPMLFAFYYLYGAIDSREASRKMKFNAQPPELPL